MEYKIMNLLGDASDFATHTDTQLSFKPFLEYLRKRQHQETSMKKEMLGMVLHKFETLPELEGIVNVNDLEKYTHLLELLHLVLTSVVEDETKIQWGLCVPMTPQVFYGTNSFYQLLHKAIQHDCVCGLQDNDLEEFTRAKHEGFYAYILQKFYGITFRTHGKMVRSLTDHETGLTRHYSINMNTDFVEVIAKMPLPKLDIETVRTRIMADDAIETLQKILPVDMFTFSGFSILTIVDVTQQFALDSLRDNLSKTRMDAENRGYPKIVQSLKELIGENNVEFNILPFIKINGKVVDNLSSYVQSVLFVDGVAGAGMNTMFNFLKENFVENPRIIFYSDLDVEVPSFKTATEILKAAGVMSYGIFPVFNDKKVVGVVEVYSKIKGLLNEKIISGLDPARELISRLMQNAINTFDDEIEAITKEKFTSLQPSVQWKFNEVAWHYLQKKGKFSSNTEPEEINFENVCPLYGAVDIRNSTIERNAAINSDIIVQFDILLQVLKKLKEQTGFGLLDEKIYSARQWSEKITPNSSLFNQELKLNEFLNNDMVPFLQKFTSGQPELYAITETYFNAINESTGIAYQHRRALESSMTKVISSVNKYFELLNDEIQQAYPCYFEKFRTDGVEYDIYIGQSITPNRPYSDIYLKNLRLMQLTSMAAITKFTHALLPSLLTPVETTQLIFVHSHPIDIRFRRDEKRFDVEGAYNIRYHIVKKRIDKVHLKDSSERLTQPHKIALVYFNEKESDEYVGYIRFLQGEGILLNDLEFLELEEVQGVSELKALRVGVNLQDDSNSYFF